MSPCNRPQQKTQYTQLPHYPRYFSYPLPAIPSSFAQNPLIRPLPGSDLLSQQSAEDLRAHLSSRCEVHDLPLPICAIFDFQLGSTEQVFPKFSIPVIGLFIFGASAAAMEWGPWKARAGDVDPGETHLVPGLPEEMAITYWDLKRKAFGPPSVMGRRPGREGPPESGDKPPWVSVIEGSVGLMFNTCDDLDGPFIKYMADMKGVDPLSPEKHWQSCDSLISDPGW